MSITRMVFAGLCASMMVLAAAGNPERVIWLDFDMQDIPEPNERKMGYYEAFFTAQITEQWKQAADVPRWIRAAIGAQKNAANVNAVDEVPNSSWYTNRHHLQRMSVAELVRGPNRSAPDFDGAVVTRAKMEGVTPGLQVKDKRGDSYLIKFDRLMYPELQSGAEVISTKILYAAGYNVPENYIAVIDPKKLRLDGIEMSGSSKEALTDAQLADMLKHAAARPDGTYRVLASKILSGKAKGPFPYVGIRADDPNDLIPHEHRRELRGLRVIASWINHWDMKEHNTLDMFVEEGGRSFLRHYLIDFGSTLGGGKSPLEYYHGRELAFDGLNMAKELLTLGFYVTPDEKEGRFIMPAVGIFSADDFDPEQWITSQPVIPFDNMTDEDAFWATRIILSFTDAELLEIVKTGQYSEAKAVQHIYNTLRERRRIIAAHWLDKVSPLANFQVAATNDPARLTLRFEDLLVKHGFATAGSGTYEYEIKTAAFKSGKKLASEPAIVIEADGEREIEISIRILRDGKRSENVRVSLQPNPGGARISRIVRG